MEASVKKLLPLALLLAGLSGCVMYGRGGGPSGQPFSYGPPAQPPQYGASQGNSAPAGITAQPLTAPGQ